MQVLHSEPDISSVSVEQESQDFELWHSDCAHTHLSALVPEWFKMFSMDSSSV